MIEKLSLQKDKPEEKLDILIAIANALKMEMTDKKEC